MSLFYEHYIRLRHIGRGANANVYKVRHAELGYVRAIKILKEHIENKSDRTYQSFIKECRTLLAIGNAAHPNIIRIYGPDLINNRAVVEMDFIQGTTLDSYIEDKGFIEYNEIECFISDIVGALAYTHYDIYKYLMNAEEDELEPDPQDGSKFLISEEKEKELVNKYGIAHNDLHSNNVMRREYDGRYVLLDFGLAVQNGECVKSSCITDGNPEYMAPEKLDAPTGIDPRSDVYSLGILLYELLAGRVPFLLRRGADGGYTAMAIREVQDAHLRSMPSAILPFRRAAFEKRYSGRAYERDYPEWLDDVIMKCLAKNPQDRFSDAKELLVTINKHTAADKAISRKSDKENLHKKIEELNKTVADSRAEIRNLEYRSGKYQKKIEELNKTIADSGAEIRNLKYQNGEYEVRINELTTQLNKVTSRSGSRLSKRGCASTDIKLFNFESELLNPDEARLDSKIKLVTPKIKLLLELPAPAISDSNSCNDNLHKKIEELESVIKDSDVQIRYLTDQIRKDEDRINSLTTKIMEERRKRLKNK